ncbi:MAG: tRNA-dependent cyclodipeptide synthase [Parcubacteria group bacterium]|nr:tRNA-dependent cyclodipeptide synthase [Parcubacteria group bacterium]
MTKEITIKETLGVSKESILHKEHNLWVGFSFGNKWFSDENLEQLIHFGIKYTKQTLLICIPSRLYATNLRFFDNLSRAEALKRAFTSGDEKFSLVQKIVSSFNDEEQNKIIVANYDDVLTPQCIKQREVLFREFSKQGEFYRLVMEISNEMLELRGRTISKDRAEGAALYILQELPLFLDGIMKVDPSIVHTVILYPGLGKFDELVMKIKNDTVFTSV